MRETIPWQRKESFTTKRNLRQVLELHDRDVVSAIVQIAGLPPYWALLQSLDLLCVWMADSLELKAKYTNDHFWLTPPPQVLLQLPQEPQEAQKASTAWKNPSKFEHEDWIFYEQLVNTSWLTASVGVTRLWFCFCACTYCCASSILSHVAGSRSTLYLSEIWNSKLCLIVKIPPLHHRSRCNFPKNPMQPKWHQQLWMGFHISVGITK